MLIVNFATADVIDRETDTCKAGDIWRYSGDIGRAPLRTREAHAHPTPFPRALIPALTLHADPDPDPEQADFPFNNTGNNTERWACMMEPGRMPLMSHWRPVEVAWIVFELSFFSDMRHQKNTRLG